MKSPSLCRLLLIMVVIALPGPATAGILDGLGAMGDSATQGNNYSGSWVPILTDARGLNFGPGRTYNRAVGGATTASVLTGGQHTQMQGLVTGGNVTLPILLIGSNDFGTSQGLMIATGTLTGTALDNWINQRATNIITATSTVLAANPEGFLLLGVPEVSMFPGASSASAIEKQRISDAVDRINDQLRDYAIAENITFLDTAAVMRDYLAPGTLVVGGVAINTATASSNPTHFFQDAIHPATVGNGLLANFVIESLNQAYDAQVALLTDLEILTLAGLQGQYTTETLSPQFDITPYIVTPIPVPEPSSVVISATALMGLTLLMRRRIKRGA